MGSLSRDLEARDALSRGKKLAKPIARGGLTLGLTRHEADVWLTFQRDSLTACPTSPCCAAAARRCPRPLCTLSGQVLEPPCRTDREATYRVPAYTGLLVSWA